MKVTETGEFYTCDGGRRLRLPRPFVTFDPQRHYLLGMVADVPVFTVLSLPEGETHSLRAVGHQLEERERDLATVAVSLVNWHRHAGFCPVCGGTTRVINGGFARVCTRCGEQLFPRTDPAVIVAILDPDDRLLLARQGSWPKGRASILAGFVEAGESLEQAIHREMTEEADVELHDLRYWGSQPWPTPRSLMLGFTARSRDGHVSVDGEELVQGRFWSREDVDRAEAAGELVLPPSSSIASRMIAAWRAGTLL
nr:NAD(+) diphosphatase [Auraticoccus cholistanensis]